MQAKPELHVAVHVLMFDDWTMKSGCWASWRQRMMMPLKAKVLRKSSSFESRLLGPKDVH